MSYGAMNRGLAAYQQVGRSAADYADPWQLTQMLLQGALDRLAQAIHALKTGEIGVKAQRISRVSAIVQALRDTLEMEHGGELAANLDALYEYMERRLFEANARNDLAMLEEVAALLKEIMDGWDAIPPEARHAQRPHGAARTAG